MKYLKTFLVVSLLLFLLAGPVISSAVSDIWSNLWDHETKVENADNQALTPGKAVTFLTITDDGTPTLAAGDAGLKKAVVVDSIVSGKAATVTPASVSGFTSITLDAVGEWVIFEWNGSAWEVADSGGGATTNE